jgi:phosphate starvation-inducible membrane PsiE
MKANQVLLIVLITIGCLLLTSQRVLSALTSPMMDALLIGGAILCIAVALIVSQNIPSKREGTGESEEGK